MRGGNAAGLRAVWSRQHAGPAPAALRACCPPAATAARVRARRGLEVVGRRIDVALDPDDREDDDCGRLGLARDQSRPPRSALRRRETDDHTHIAIPPPHGLTYFRPPSDLRRARLTVR